MEAFHAFCMFNVTIAKIKSYLNSPLVQSQSHPLVGPLCTFSPLCLLMKMSEMKQLFYVYSTQLKIQ